MARGSRLTIPPFYCPIPPARLRPDAEAIEERARTWLTESGAYTSRRQIDALAAAKAAIVIPQAMPDAIPERLQIAADWMYWGFAFDDGLFEDGPYGDRPGPAVELLGTMARIVESPESRLLPGDPWADALRDLLRRVALYGTPEQRSRWVTGVRTYFTGLAWESHYRHRTSPTVDTYLMIRRGSIGMEPLTSLNDLADGYVLPAESYHHPVVRALTEMTWTLIICDNDLYSYNKESTRGPNLLNYITCLAAQRGAEPAAVLPEATAMRDRMMTLFLRLREQAARDASEPLRRYLRALGQWLRANTDWALGSSRYGTGPVSSGYTDHPTDTSAESLPLPSSSWWWELLEDPPSATRPIRPRTPPTEGPSHER